MPTRREIDNAEAGGEPLQPAEKLACLVISVRCAHCLKLTPDVDLHRCGGCKQVGYCDEAPPGQTKTCHKVYWKAGHKHECARFAAEEKAEEAEAAAAGPGVRAVGVGVEARRGRGRRGRTAVVEWRIVGG